MKRKNIILCFVILFIVMLSSSLITSASTTNGSLTFEVNGFSVIDDTHVYFGSYPQREVVGSASQSGVYGNSYWGTTSTTTNDSYIVDSELYATLKGLAEGKWDSNGDTTVDGAKYRRIKKSNATYSYSSSYYYSWSNSTTYHYFKYEPIKWRILKSTENDAFLLCDMVIDDQMYNTSNTSITWEKSTVRSWLNGYGSSTNSYGTNYSGKGFYDVAFNATEKGAIKTTNVVNANNKSYGTYGGNNTQDKVFLLSEDEVYGSNATQNGFSSWYENIDRARQIKSSTYAKAMGTYASISGGYYGNCYWWLRSPGFNTFCAVYIGSNGYVNQYGSSVCDGSDGILPALHINLKSNSPNEAYVEISDIKLAFDTAWYTGKEIKPEVTIKGLIEGKDYTVSYSNNNDIGTASVTATATEEGACTGSVTKTFDILDPETIKLSQNSYTYDGKEKTPEVTVKGLGEGTTLTKGTDYTVEYKNNVKAGTAKAIITLKGNYEGTLEKTFEISRQDISDKDVSLSSNLYACEKNPEDRDAKEPIVTIEGLEKDNDYTVEYENNINPGTAKVIIKGIDNYCGTIEKAFRIGFTMSGTPTLSKTSYVYDGKAKEPTVSLEGYTEGTDFEVSYLDNIEIGTATVKLTGIGDYIGTKSASFTIHKVKLENASINLESSHFAYYDTAIEPDFDVKLDGEILDKTNDYTIKYSSNTSAGTGTITVAGKGNYEGSKSKTFEIHQLTKYDAVETLCSAEGNSEYYECSCGKYYEDSSCTKEIEEDSWIIEKSEHDWNADFTVDKAATCTETGSKSKHCKNCTEKSEVTEIPAINHDWDEGEVSTQPTCIDEGEKTFHCKRGGCNGTKTEEIAINPDSHKWDEGEVTKEPTYTEKGEKTFKCTRSGCKETKTEEIKEKEYTVEVKGSIDRLIYSGTVTFGSYPQTEIVNSEDSAGACGKPWVQSGDYEVDETLYSKLLTATYDNNGDTIIDDVKYHKLKKNEATYIATSTEVQYYDYYDWGNEEARYFRYDPIKWRVLDKDGDDILVVADKAIEGKRFDTTQGSRTWERSYIRSWLNYSFYNRAFNTLEQSYIKITDVENSIRVDERNVTKDKVFLLSEDEVCGTTGEKYGFTSDTYDDARYFKSSTYAKAMGAYSHGGEYYTGNCQWWLRTPGYRSGSAVVVSYYGSLEYDAAIALNYKMGVVPALHISLETNDQISGIETITSKKSISNTSITLEKYTVPYNGKPIEPKVSIKGLKEGEDFNVTYSNNEKLGVGLAIATGIGKYSGTLSINFEIVDNVDISNMEAVLDETTYTYNGEPCKPKVTIKGLKEEEDFTVEYSHNNEPGDATATITGINGYVGSISKSFTIKQGETIVNKNIILSDTLYIHNGSERRPAVTISGLHEGTDYTVTYSDNIEVGTAKATVKGIGNYTGTVEKEFSITHYLEHHESKASTCTEKGFEAYDTCKVEGCDYSTYDKSSEAKKLGHDWDEGETTIQPTCTENGEKTFHCKRDGCTETKKEEIAELNHDWNNGEVTKQTSCTEKGEKTFHCKRECCNGTKTEEIAVLGHSWNEGKVTKEPTEMTSGEKTYKCTRCNETKTESIAALGTAKNVVSDLVDSLQNLDTPEKKADAIAGFQTTIAENLSGIAYSLEEGATGTVAEQMAEIEAVVGTATVDAEDSGLSNVSIIGGGLNKKSSGETPKLTIEAVSDTTKIVASLPDNVDPENVTVISMNLENAAKDKDGNLAVPVLITFSVPSEIDADKFVVVHMSSRGIELITPTLSTDKKTASIVVTHFSDFVLTETTEHRHNLIAVDAKSATCTTDGNTAYWYCDGEDCGKYFSDAKGENEIANGSWVIKASHNYQHYERGAGYMSNGEAYDKCSVCGNTINYRVLEGYSTSYVKGFKVSKGKKCFTAKWKKQNKKTQKLFSGYQVRWSTDPGMGGAGYKNVGKGKASVKIKGGAKTRYYVQVRTYTGGYYSPWSAMKSVVTK